MDDFLPPYNDPRRTIPRNNSFLDYNTAVGELMGMVGSAALAEPISGIGGIFGGDVRGIQDALTYSPRSDIANQWLGRAGEAIAPAASWISDKAVGIESGSGIPREATLAALQMGLEAFPAAKIGGMLNPGRVDVPNLNTPMSNQAGSFSPTKPAAYASQSPDVGQSANLPTDIMELATTPQQELLKSIKKPNLTGAAKRERGSVGIEPELSMAQAERELRGGM